MPRTKQKDDVEQIVAKAFAHPLRVQILIILNERVASPNLLAQELDQSLNLVAYHVRVLEKYDCIELVDTKQRRGATEHFYRATRRQFLKFLSASPYVASAGGIAAFLQSDSIAQDIKQSSFASIMRDRMSVVDNPKDALTVFDFEATARTKVQQGHWSYMASGTDDDATLFANREGFRQLQLRPRRLRE